MPKKPHEITELALADALVLDIASVANSINTVLTHLESGKLTRAEATELSKTIINSILRPVTERLTQMANAPEPASILDKAPEFVGGAPKKDATEFAAPRPVSPVHKDWSGFDAAVKSLKASAPAPAKAKKKPKTRTVDLEEDCVDAGEPLF